MTFVIANQKGGVGKSTIATNIAAILAARNHVLLIDHDTSHVSANFHTRRKNNPAELAEFDLFMPADVDEMVELIEMENFNIRVIDLGGFTDDLAKAALVYADVIIVPTSTSTQDMDGNIHFMQTLDKLKDLGMKSKILYVANNTDPRMKRPRIDTELDYITDRGYSVAGVIPHYAAFSVSHGKGMSIVEYAPNSKGAIAMQQLVQVLILEAKNEQ